MIFFAKHCFTVAIVLMIVLLAGCTTKSTLQRNEQNAYLAGQNAILKQQAEMAGVTVLGPVKNSHVPWVVGLTLAQAIATAQYLDSNDPKEIIITRNGESATVDPKVLLQGTDVPLEVGDVIELRP
jgi:uncharacterized membrane protein